MEFLMHIMVMRFRVKQELMIKVIIMKKKYEYLFYRFYKYMENKKNYENATHGALIFLSILTFLNSLTIIVYLKNIFSLNFYNQYYFILFGLLVYFGNRWYFNNDLKVIKIIDTFNNESEKSRYIGIFITVLICILTFIMLVTSYNVSLWIKNIVGNATN